ncbi:MAG: hypothetical protein R3E79_61170 [Caldilineaceae bacterium]
MLIAIVLTLTSPTDAVLPAHLGRANYAATLARLQAMDPAWARRCTTAPAPSRSPALIY